MSASPLAAQTGELGRPLTIDDLRAIEKVEAFTFAPDGQALAYVRRRPQTSARRDYDVDAGNGEDVWVQFARGQEARNVTQGAKDGTSWWQPRWSPDGQRLAMRSTRYGRVTVWVWERSSGALRQLLPQAVQLNSAEQWIDGRRLLVHLQAAADTMRGRHHELPAGDGLTASVREAGAGITADGATWPQGPLVLVDVSAGTQRVVAPAVHQQIGLAPGRRLVAVTRVAQVRALWAGYKPLANAPEGLQLTIDLHALDGRAVRLNAPLPSDVMASTMQWSPDGAELAFLSYGTSRSAPPQLVRVRPDQGEIHVIALDSLGAASARFYLDYALEWTKAGDVVVKAGRWWFIPRAGPLRALTETEKIALAAPDSATAFRTRLENAVRKLSPAHAATLIAVAPTSEDAVFMADDRTGMHVWRVIVATGRAETLVIANTHLREVAHGTWQSVRYTSLRGEPRTALLLRPPGVPPGVRVPLIVSVYPGDTNPTNVSEVLKTRVTGFDLQAARGYAVLMPSMGWQLQNAGGPGPLPQLPNGVLPAVDSVIAQGIADPERLFVEGHSYGGFATVGLVAQTKRFKAAVAGAGLYNRTSFVGTFGTSRYQESGPFLVYRGFFEEISAEKRGDLGGPPWTDPERYLRNSPLFLADRIETPILFIHGDRDIAVPMEQSEEMFSALWRQGKRARFVRYWDEGHVINKRPANVRDMNYQKIAWYDEFGDITRDAQGDILWENGVAKSRAGQPALTVADFARFDALAHGRRPVSPTHRE